MKAAAAIIREDIRSMIYNTEGYPSPDAAFGSALAPVPRTLQIFTEDVVTKNRKTDLFDLQRKCTFINHAIVYATRPRSFVSMLQVGLSVYIHRLIASRHLIDVLNSLGVCASYNEAQRYEAAVMVDGKLTLSTDCLIQFVFDNADFNINSLDGKGTFHSMGGIMCVTPGRSLKFDASVARPAEIKKALTLAQINKVNLLTYCSQTSKGLNSVKIRDVQELRNNFKVPYVAQRIDLLWMCGKYVNAENNPNWSGFMELMTSGLTEYEVSKISILPFINLNPTTPDAIYSTLKYAAEQCKKYGQKTCIITFDQPLYAKSAEMIEKGRTERDADLSNIILRLGGFHLLMSFMGAAGYIMAGSGLKDLWALIYATNSTEKMLAGHSYSRALRAHFLTGLALATIALRQLDIDDDTKQQLLELHQSVVEGTASFSVELLSQQPVLVDTYQKVIDFMEMKANKSHTAKLWINYFNLVQIMRLFVGAERRGDWYLHLQCVADMIPYFHSTGHLAYAKSAHLYVQQMSNIQDHMTEEEFNKFTKGGFFTVRRTDKMWSGIWSDMTVEQVLMRSMKTSGGLTHGRGITESVLKRWVQGMPGCSALINHFQDYCGKQFLTGEQHVELRMSRQIRDSSDVDKLIMWFTTHSPFPDCVELMSISTGITATEAVNCDQANEIGKKVMHTLTDKNFGDLHLRRKDKVLNLASVTSSIKIREETVPVNTMKLFNRIACTIKSEENLANILEHELAPVPLSMFDEFSIRKTNKAAMYDVVESYTSVIEPVNTGMQVIDGGFLLRRVTWPSNHVTYLELYQCYLSYIERHHVSTKTVVVFDGYNLVLNTKSLEHSRRAMKAQSIEIQFTDDMNTTCSQQQFLANDKNKEKLIMGLSKHLQQAGITIKKAAGDADSLIVTTALEICRRDNVVVQVIGTDVDLLLLLIQLRQLNDNICFVKPPLGKEPCKMYDIGAIQNTMNMLSSRILFIHTITGCDTTSSLYRQGKKKACQLLQKFQQKLLPCVDVFYDNTASKEDIIAAGEQFLLALYGAPSNTKTLNEHRYHCYIKAVARSQINKEMQLASLPPTSAAASQHSLRTYHQLQHWLGRDMQPIGWGWYILNNQLLSVMTTLQPAPDYLLNLVSCACKTGCERVCGCKSSGLHCSILCRYCQGHGCQNSSKTEATGDSESESEDDSGINDNDDVNE